MLSTEFNRSGSRQTLLHYFALPRDTHQCIQNIRNKCPIGICSHDVERFQLSFDLVSHIVRISESSCDAFALWAADVSAPMLMFFTNTSLLLPVPKPSYSALIGDNTNRRDVFHRRITTCLIRKWIIFI